MRLTALLLLIAAVGLVGTAVAADNTAPLADAGVDQTVVVNSTVYLDANASTDPDGEIRSVEWSIETPAGSTMSPDCGDCRRTEFEASSLGQYTVTLTVTDDDGATRSDTLYVTSTTERGPNVSVSGPDATAAGENPTFTANVSAAQSSLQTLTWLVNGSVVERTSLDGASANHSLTHSIDETVPVRAVVYDTLGNRGSATHRVAVSGGGTGYQCLPNFCDGDGADRRWTEDGVTVLTDTSDTDGLQTFQNGALVTIKNPGENPKIERGINGEYRVEGGLSSLSEDAFKPANNESQESSRPESAAGSPGGSFRDSVSSIVDAAIDGFTEDQTGGGSGDDGGSSKDSGGGYPPFWSVR